jgi:hypothetical protein
LWAKVISQRLGKGQRERGNPEMEFSIYSGIYGSRALEKQFSWLTKLGKCNRNVFEPLLSPCCAHIPLSKYLVKSSRTEYSSGGSSCAYLQLCSVAFVLKEFHRLPVE